VERLPALAGARHEVEAIASLWGGDALPLLGKQASEAAILRLAPGAAVLHLATHAVIDERSPLSSAVVLAAGEGKDGPNGLLQAWEILERLHLEARLVTLSGCETGLGRELAGEGLLGLTRAFELAGAGAVLHTLWRVEDRVQSELMIRVYTAWRRGLALDEAVRQAQLSFITGPTRLPAVPASAGGRALAAAGLLPDDHVDLSHPFYWASLRLDGDGR
jgi:CHAT domain-containing protein